MSIARDISKGIIIGGLALMVIFAILFYIGVPLIMSQFAPKVPVTKKYTTGLTASFKLYDTATYSLVTSDVSPEFYKLSDNPFGYTVSGLSPVSVGTYDSVNGVWEAVLDAGSYKLLVKDVASTPTKYPALVTVSVPATDSEDREVTLDPYMIHLEERADISLSITIKAYNSTSGAYDITVSEINITAYDKWLTTLEITVAGTNKVIKAGRIYMSKISGLVPKKALLDGKEVSIIEDTDASDDGLTGYYVEFKSDWKGGEIHRLDVYWEEVGTASTGTLSFTIFDYYSCLNRDLRWWTTPSISVNVVS